MFDPTAFENMKVVIEGFIYDKDLDGELKILDRNDFVNLSKLSREYSIQFQLRNSTNDINSNFKLKAGIENLAAELLEENILSKKQGCIVQLQFNIIHENNPEFFAKLQTGLQLIWGNMRTIRQIVQFNPLDLNKLVQNQIIIEFNRLIQEEQMDDLIEMIEHMIETLTWLESVM